MAAATNRPENIDIVIMRPSIDKKVYVGLPEYTDRTAIVTIGFTPMSPTSDITPTIVANHTEGYTGAEIISVCKEAAFSVITRDINAESFITNDLNMALSKVKPRITTEKIE